MNNPCHCQRALRRVCLRPTHRPAGRVCSLRLAYALARKERGSWRLEWSGLPAEYSSTATAPPAADDYYRLALRRHIGRSLL